LPFLGYGDDCVASHLVMDVKQNTRSQFLGHGYNA